MDISYINEAQLNQLEMENGPMYFGPGANSVPMPRYMVLDLESGELTTNKGVRLGFVHQNIVNFAKRIIKDFDDIEQMKSTRS